MRKTINIVLIIIFIFCLSESNAQKIFNTKIQNPRNIIITNKIDSQIIYNNINNTTNKIYLLGVDDLSYYVGTNIKENTPEVTKMNFGNPDSLTMQNINFIVKFSKPFDTAYFLNVLPAGTKFNPFNRNSPIRDCVTKIAFDKKSISFKAGYIKAGHLISLMVFYPSNIGNKAISIEGAGKLW